jgi:RNA methyltransferase, TrmH family
MLSKNEVKYIQSLYHKKQRIQEGLFVAEGIKLVNEFLASNFIVHTVYTLQENMPINIGDVNCKIVTQTELQSISNLQTPNGMLAVVQQQTPSTQPVFTNKLTLVLDGIQDPGNMGTILRIANWFGITQIIASNNTVEIYNPKVVQSTMGSIIQTKVWYKDLPIFLQSISIPIYGAVLNGASIYTTPKPKEGILIIGNEGNGISNDVLPFITHAITIPKIGEAESLNAAVATGIILSHLV